MEVRAEPTRVQLWPLALLPFAVAGTLLLGPAAWGWPGEILFKACVLVSLMAPPRSQARAFFGGAWISALVFLGALH